MQNVECTAIIERTDGPNRNMTPFVSFCLLCHVPKPSNQYSILLCFHSLWTHQIPWFVYRQLLFCGEAEMPTLKLVQFVYLSEFSKSPSVYTKLAVWHLECFQWYAVLPNVHNAIDINASQSRYAQFQSDKNLETGHYFVIVYTEMVILS